MADGSDQSGGRQGDGGALPPPDDATQQLPPPPDGPPDAPPPPQPPPPDGSADGSAGAATGASGAKKAVVGVVAAVAIVALAIGGLVLTGVIGGDDDGGAITATDEGSEPVATEPPTTEPPTTEPPATEPPATEPPATEPPATEPPATTEPPTTEPPTTEPPATTEPPSTTEPEEESGRTVLLEPIGDPGPNPFTSPVAPEPDETLEVFAARGTPPPEESAAPDADVERPDPGEALVQRDTHLEIDGATAGLYGGTLDSSSCDPDQLVQFLDENPELGEAWADVHGIEPDEIADFVDELTPVNLGADTRVLNHGFEDGDAVSRHSVLQRGSAVMVDDRGVPRVNCYCGNPLLESEPEVGDELTGDAWETFDPNSTLVVAPTEEPIEEFTLTDVATGDPFDRPAGTTGELDTSFMEALGRPDATPGGDCGLVPDPGDLGDAEFLVDDIRILLEGEGQNCEIAVEVTVQFMRRVANAVLDPNVAFPYRPQVLGWNCTTGPFLADQVPDSEFFGCREPNSGAAIRLVPG